MKNENVYENPYKKDSYTKNGVMGFYGILFN